MKAKLIKTHIDWLLIVNNNQVAGSLNEPDSSKGVQKLSLKNCEAIANGWDLDDIVEQTKQTLEDSRISSYDSFKIGFQKAVEILGDKKFSESDMIHAYIEGTNDGAQFESMMDYDHSDNSEAQNFSEQAEQDFRKLLQQTQWDVEIEMKYVPSLSYCNKCQKLINPLIPCTDETKSCGNWRPQLDEDNCLILKRI